MLHAIAGKKTSRHKVYLGKREEGEKQVREEDELTSTLLGPLDFLPTAEAFLFWRELIGWCEKYGASSIQGFFPEPEPDRVVHKFWAQRTGSKGRIEPDLFVEFHWNATTERSAEQRFLLVELKWRAPLSGKEQLQKQWLGFLTDAERHDSLHLFIAPETSAATAVLAEFPHLWNGRGPVRIPWVDVLEAVRGLGSPGSGILRWATNLQACLERLQISRFRGFNSADSFPGLPTTEDTAVFWNPKYWRSLPSLPAATQHQALFFRGVSNAS